ncbi:MAG: hypothetical protein WA706_13465 [Pseudolabrys sp.]
MKSRQMLVISRHCDDVRHARVDADRAALDMGPIATAAKET